MWRNFPLMGCKLHELSAYSIQTPRFLNAATPFCLVACSVGHGEYYTAVGILLTMSDHVASVAGLDGVLLITLGIKLFLRVALDIIETRCAVVEGQTDGIENRRFPSSRVASDGIETCRTQRLGIEVDDVLALEGRYIAESYLFYLHYI